MVLLVSALQTAPSMTPIFLTPTLAPVFQVSFSYYLDCPDTCEASCGSDHVTCTDTTKASACRPWSFLDQQGECTQFACPARFYRNPSDRKCEPCHPSCHTCSNSGDTGCLACPTGSYLEVASDLNTHRPNGRCLPKEQYQGTVFALIVTNELSIIQNGLTSSERDGSLQNPFTDIRDALIRADELAAPLSEISVQILLTRGEHYILRRQFSQFYLPQQSSDTINRLYNLKIKPLPCDFSLEVSKICVDSSHKVTLINKIGAYFRMMLPTSATIEEITFDFSDSLLTWGSQCQLRRSRSCQVTVDSLDKYGVQALDPDCECNEQPVSRCVAHHSISLFELPAYSSNSVPFNMKLLNVQVKHIYSNYNSILPLQATRGSGIQIEIKNSQFEDISICGSILNSESKAPSLLFSQVFDPFYSLTQASSGQTSSLLIEDSEFTRIGLLVLFQDPNSLQNVYYQNSETSFTSISPLINLNAFPGKVSLIHNSISRIKLAYDKPLSLISVRPITVQPTQSLAVSRGGLLTHGVVVITNHIYGLSLISNTFKQSSGLRGVILGSLASSYERGFILYNNTFHSNSAVYSGVVNLKALTLEDAQSCAGFHLESNVFSHNLLSANQMSVLTIGCLFPGFIHNDNVDDINAYEYLAQASPSRTAINTVQIPFTQEVNGVESSYTIEGDFASSLLRDNLFIENLRMKGVGTMLVAAFLKNLKVEATSMIRNGDYSLYQYYPTQLDFFQNYGGIHLSYLEELPNFQDIILPPNVFLGALLYTFGDTSGLKVLNNSGTQNWMISPPFQVQIHFMALQYCIQAKVQGLTVNTFVQGEEPQLMAYLSSPHELTRSAVLSSEVNQGQIHGSLISVTQSASFSQLSLSNINLLNYIVYTLPGVTIEINDSEFENIRMAGFHTPNLLSLELRNCRLINLSFTNALTNALRVELQGVVYDNSEISTSSSKIMALYQPYMSILVSNTEIIQPCGAGVCQDYIVEVLEQSAEFRFINSTIENFRGEESAFGINSGLGIIEDSKFLNNQGVLGSSSLTSSGNGNLTIINTLFTNNTALQGGAIVVQNTGSLSMRQCSFVNNTSNTFGGAISATGQNRISMRSILFQNNRAVYKGSAIYMVQQDPFTTQDFQDIDFIQNEGEAVLLFIGANLSIKQAKFLNNLNSQMGASPLKSFGSSLLIQESLFSNKESEVNCSQASHVQGGFIDDVAQNQLRIESSFFEQNCATQGGALYFGGQSHIEISNSTFRRLKSMTRGGAINGNSFSTWTIEDSTFEQNEAKQHGGDIYLHFSDAQLITRRSTFSRTQTNSIYTFQTGIALQDSEFFDMQLQEQPAVVCIQCTHFIIKRCLFKNLELSSAIVTEDLASQGKYTVSESIFENIHSESNGGALRVYNSDLQISSSWFKNASVVAAKGQGGAISIESTHYTNVTVKNNEFQKCFASRGGAIFWNYNQPLLLDNSFSENTVTFYGTNVASYGCKVQVIPEEVGEELYGGPIKPVQTEGEDFIRLKDQRSGDELPQFFIAVLDWYNQVVTDIEGGAVNLGSELLGPMTPNLGTEEILNENTNVWHNGVFEFEDVVMIAHPEHQFKISIYSTHVDPSLPASQASLIKANKTEPTVDIYAYVRPCISGESYLYDGECKYCPEGSFLIDPPKSRTACIICPSTAVCFGGNQVAPKVGYWRSGFESLHFVQCFNPSACISSSVETYDPKGQCARGYTGTLCSSCESNFTRNSNFKCNECPPLGPNIAILLIVFAALAATFVIIIKWTLRSAKKKKSLFTVYFKILVNHLQVLMLIYSFELDWPREVGAFLDTSKTVATAPEALFSFDCFLQQSIGAPLKRFYIYLLLYFSLPLWGVLFAFLFWRFKYHSNTRAMAAKLVPTLLITFYLIHPSVTRSLLLAFDCYNIDGQLYLKEELSEVCWQGQHLIFALTIGTMGLALWSLGIPLFSCYLLHRKRNSLYDLDVKERYGFLYNGYTERTYYWEAVISLRKFIIGFVAILLTSKGTMLQSLVLFVILVLSILHTVKERPYVDYRVNHLEIISLISLLVTAYCGIFFLSDRNSQSDDFVVGRDLNLSPGERWLLFLSVFASNLLFTLMWLKLIFIQIIISTYKKCPRCYLACCLRGRRERLQRASTFFKDYEDSTQKILLLQEIQQETQALMSFYKKSKNPPRKKEVEALVFKFRHDLQSLTLSNGLSSSPFRKSRVAPKNNIQFELQSGKLGQEDYSQGCQESAPSTRRGFFNSPHDPRSSDIVHPSSLFNRNQNLKLLHQTWVRGTESQQEGGIMRLESIDSKKQKQIATPNQANGSQEDLSVKPQQARRGVHVKRRSFSSQNMSHVCITKQCQDQDDSF